MTIDKSKFRITITGPYTGQDYIIRRIKMREFLECIGALPVQESETLLKELEAISTEVRKKAAADPEAEAKTIRFYLEKGIISPTIFFGPEAECPDDQICVADLGDEASYLVKAIAEFSFQMKGFQQQKNFFFRELPGDT